MMPNNAPIEHHACIHTIKPTPNSGLARTRSGVNDTLPFTERVALVRVMGGWKTSAGAPNATDDFVRVNRSATPPLSYAWDRLWKASSLCVETQQSAA